MRLALIRNESESIYSCNATGSRADPNDLVWPYTKVMICK